ncbi:hypothetical protein [Aquimarina muelleri]|nr:hypothetical protein [Aquimarina muelleri]MCX2762249.1 hypothetical protein [Aquimarina muelleri]
MKHIKSIKRVLFASIILMLIGFIFRGTIYRKVVKYKPLQQRSSYIVQDDDLINYIEVNSQKKTIKVEGIIKVGLFLTSKKLRFIYSKNHNNPNELIKSKTANCIGYASFFSSVCNYLFKKYHLNDWVAKPYKGLIYFFGKNLHLYFNSAFFKDHDFVIIENTITGQSFAVDPSINDYLFIDLVEKF